jgi:diguanylate cyclase (GGDEF)-like protein
MLNLIKPWLDARSSVQIVCLGLLLTGLVGQIDYITGIEISFSVFYLLPIALVTWYAQRWIGYSLCCISAIVWLLSDHLSGATYSYWLIPIWNALVRLSFFFMTAFLLGELKGYLKSEEALARTDGLTHLLNGRAFKDVTSRSINLAARHGHPVVLGYIDVDNFKGINDKAGHDEGDRVLQAVAESLNNSIRSTDVAGRLGGDEFAVFMPEIGAEGARIAFNKLHAALNQMASAHNWPIGFSMGIAIFPTAPSGIDEALKIGDSLMYRVKQSGKNNVMYEEQGSQEVAAAPRLH